MPIKPLVLLLSLAATPVAAQTPPIFNPGAPGAPTRTITAAEAREMTRTRVTAEDVRFMQHMIVHHAQAVEMVDLLKLHGVDPAVRRLGERISLSQEAEIELMREWLTGQGQSLEAHDLHAGHGGHDAHAGHAGHEGHAMPDPADTPVMPGMLTPRQMATLAAARGETFDRLFLQGMIQHHQGALDMADELLAHDDSAEEPMLSGFVASVVADQSAEILRMQSLLSERQT